MPTYHDMCPDACKIPPTIVVIGLGSNLGDRLETMRQALAALLDGRLALLAKSGVYETAPCGGPPQPDYLNAAAALCSTLPLRAVLDRALAVERSLGRVRPDPLRWGPRTIDLDLLWTSSDPIDEPGLVVPHPRLQERPFALQPLLDVQPDARDPHSGEAYASLPAAGSRLRRVAEL